MYADSPVAIVTRSAWVVLSSSSHIRRPASRKYDWKVEKLTEIPAGEPAKWAFDPDGTTSMLQDRENNRGPEHEGLTGTVVRLAGQHGIPTPVSDTILALLRGLSVNDRA